MIGAKQFAIMRKIIEDKKENPIVKNIAMPPWLKGEKELNSLSGNLLDKIKSNSKILEEVKKPIEADIPKESFNKPYKKEIKENPIVKNISKPLAVMKESDIHKFSEGLFDKFNAFSKMITKSQKLLETQIIKEEDKKELSEEVLNKLTYQVFQNIKGYLNDSPENPVGSKHIKLEISL